MNPIAIRLLSQQLISPQFNSPKEVIAHMGAVQAQDYRMMRWAVMMRMKKPSAKAFRQAYDAGEIIRLHLLRGTWSPWENHLKTSFFLPPKEELAFDKQWKAFCQLKK